MEHSSTLFWFDTENRPGHLDRVEGTATEALMSEEFLKTNMTRTGMC
jgi:hypothetical protein